MTDGTDLTFMHSTEPALGAQDGLTLMHVHGRDKCEGRGIPCCIHDPSDHHMCTWPMNWRSDTGVMERICPHGIGHPDPDHMAYVRSLTPEHECIFNRDRDYSFNEWFDLDEQDGCIFPHLEWQGVHGCDGCCTVKPLLRRLFLLLRLRFFRFPVRHGPGFRLRLRRGLRLRLRFGQAGGCLRPVGGSEPACRDLRDRPAPCRGHVIHPARHCGQGAARVQVGVVGERQGLVAGVDSTHRSLQVVENERP